MTLHGHAIECRLNAEDRGDGYRPSPGTLSLFAVPERAGLRVDTHCEAGALVPPYYDSLLAKLIGHGADREHAIDILLEALEDLDVDGVETNRTLLIGVLGHPDFRAGAVTTAGYRRRSLRDPDDRVRGHHHARRQPEPVERHGADHARTCWRSRR